MKLLPLSFRFVAPVAFAVFAASPLRAQEPIIEEPVLQEPVLEEPVLQEPVLEKYSLGVGMDSDGVAAALTDRFFGGGTARATLAFLDTAARQTPADETGSLVVNVVRFVRRNEITFALLCSGVKVRGLDGAGLEIFSEDLPAFTFGDSQSGRYTQVLRKIPLSVATIEVTFFGNYE